MAVEHRHIELGPGRRVHYARQGDPAGETIVLLHGYTDSWRSFELILPLIPASYQVYAVDLRGHGDSDAPATGYAPADFAGDIDALLVALNIERATLVGHSLGSFIARQVALRSAARVERLVLVGSGLSARGNAAIAELQAAVAALSEPVDPLFVRAFQSSTIAAPVPPAFFEDVVAASSRVPVRVWQQTLAAFADDDHRDELAQIAVPTLILWGERDELFPLAEQQALAARIPQAALKAYPATGHALHWERPDAFSADLLAFVAATAATGVAPASENV